MNFLETFSGKQIESGLWSFDLEEQFNGAFGGTNGGVLAAVTVHVARHESGGRRPTAVDARFIRGFAPGPARVEVTALNVGRTLAVYNVDIISSAGKLCTRAGVTLAAAEQLASEVSGDIKQQVPDFSASKAKAWPHPAGFKVPLIDSFKPAACHDGLKSITQITLPWEEQNTAAEAACVVSDISVGPPVGRMVRGRASIPNPDLTLRFSPAASTINKVEACCELIDLTLGQATTRIDTWCGDELLAVGVSTTTCIPQ
ncbi:MAG: thioesterase family protein [Pseudomonadales bacterium]|nr:thioesterase family protein [Pseudomonadales bacterium]